MGKPKKTKHKKVSQKRFERLQKRAAKNPDDRLLGGKQMAAEYTKDTGIKISTGEIPMVGKLSRKGHLKKTFTSKHMPALDPIGQMPKEKIMDSGSATRYIHDMLRMSTTFPGVPMKEIQNLPRPISKRTPMKSKYGGTLLPEVEITAPAYKPRAQQIMTPLASLSPMTQKLSSKMKETKLPLPQSKATRTKKAREKAKKGK